ncbi:MAG: hypothetical protein QOF30_3146 [Acidimicrobiaceae bacterium]|jgi:hypothetical protein|nr:hypothetical protein [Acidimicrobiaceae bacterium]
MDTLTLPTWEVDPALPSVDLLSPAPTLVDRYDAEGVAQVVRALEAIQVDADRRDPLYENDGVACFDYLYTVITKNVLRCVHAKGYEELDEDDPRFQDLAFLACLDVAFANRYLEALGFGEAPEFQPSCWQTLIDHREMRDISPLVFAIAGVNAHVNFDLPFALIKACSVLASELDSGTHHEDYQLINQIFALHMQQLRRHFENRFERGFDRALVSTIENLLGDLVVVVARDMAWMTAKRLWRFHEDKARMLRAAKSRDRWVRRVNNCLFKLDRLPAAAFRGLHLVPGPSRAVAQRGLGRTGWVARDAT